MERLRRFIVESAFRPEFANAVYDAIGMLEAVNINKALFLKEAGSPEAVKAAKDRVNQAWTDEEMNGIVRGNNLLQKLMNFLYLMEIRKAGFVNADVLHKIHDVSLHGSLEQKFLSKVDSDTTPEMALQALDAATESARQASKPYPDLTDDEEKLWNRVRVYHTFPDGFQWVYAVDASGKIAPCISSDVTYKTMHHCGNTPRAGSDDQYYELRDSNGKAYLTVILNNAGEVEESKSWGNQVSKYRQQILPYVKWFLKDQKVTGVGFRYDNGYATDKNFGVKDFIGDDPEFVDYVIENKDSLIGNAESRILFWRNAIEDGLVTVDDLKNAYASDIGLSEFMKSIPGLSEYSNTAKFPIKVGKADPYDSMFGANSFAVLCAACGGNPFTEEELVKLIDDDKLRLEVFANYNISLLTPEIQDAFVRHDDDNLKTLIEISNQVAAFKISKSIYMAMLPTEEQLSGLKKGSDDDKNMLRKCRTLLKMVRDSNPPSKMADTVRDMMASDAFLKYMYGVLGMTKSAYDNRFRYCSDTPSEIYMLFAEVIGKYKDIELPPGFAKMHSRCMLSVIKSSDESHGNIDAMTEMLDSDYIIGEPRNAELLSFYNDDILKWCIVTIDRASSYGRIKRTVREMCEMFTPERVKDVTVSVGATSIGVNGALCTMFPTDPQTVQFAKNGVDAFINQKNGNRYSWDGSYYYWEVAHADVVMDMLLSVPGVIEELDWKNRNTWKAVSWLFTACTQFQIDMKRDNMERVLLFYLSKLHSNPAYAYKILKENSQVLPIIERMINEYGIENDIISAVFREQAELTMQEDPGYRLVGPWTMFEIPFEEWESEFDKYGFVFLNCYVMRIPADRLFDDAYITDFVCDKLLATNSESDIISFVDSIDNDRSKKSRFAKMISKRIVENRFDMSKELFDILYSRRLINAAAYTAVTERRADRGAVEIDSLEAANNVLKAFNSIQKLGALPELLSSTFKYLTDTIFAHLGDGKFRWKVDEECSGEVSLLCALAEKISAKAKSGMMPLAIKRLFDDGIVDRLDGFTDANRAACADPAHPKSKLICSSAYDLGGAVNDLQDALTKAQPVLDKGIAVPKPKASRKRAAASPA